jgi:hypothetical protein
MRQQSILFHRDSAHVPKVGPIEVNTMEVGLLESTSIEESLLDVIPIECNPIVEGLLNDIPIWVFP